MSAQLLVAILTLTMVASVPAAEFSLAVSKAARKIVVYRGTELLHTFPIALGTSPEGHKLAEGDRKTPEGDYFICAKNPGSKYYLSLAINYPNANDASVALAEGRITRDEHDQIVAAENNRQRPPWKTALGGEIYIHGKGSKPDWTLGCIALDDHNMKILFELIPIGTPIKITP